MPAKILIVEDDEEIRRGLGIRLRASGFDTAFASDGISAVSATQREKPDLVLLDLGLPGGDGYLVMERLQMVAPEVPVVVLSARDPFINRDRSLRAGAQAFLQKPVDNGELLSVIRRILGLETEPATVAARGPAKVLVVEDDEDIRRGLGIRLKASGYETIFAGDAISAVRTAQKERPDAVLLDLGLPGGDGYVVMDRLRIIAPEVPVIVLSARDPLLNRDRALNAGAQAFLQKPVDNEELLGVIGRALAGNGVAAPRRVPAYA